jgi:hypothetical protein
MNYTTLTQMRRILFQQNITTSLDDGDDALIQRYIIQSSDAVKRITGRRFDPYFQDRLHDYQGAYALNLNADLLELDTLTNGNTQVIASSVYLFEPANDYPKWRIRIKRSSSVSFTFTADPEQAISVAGWWGYHTDYDNAYIDTLETVPIGDLSAGATTFTAIDVDGLNEQGVWRFEVGQLLRIDDELILIVGLNTSTNVVTIRRGQNGTTAAAHTAGTVITSWQVLPALQWQCERMVMWAYQHRDAVESLTFLDTNVTLKDETLKDIVSKLTAYQPVQLGDLSYG